MVKILAVDDSKSMRHMVSQTLTDAGFETQLACDGVEALAMAQEFAADLVLTDVNMPNMDGITLVKRLRELPEYRYKPILVLTTESSMEKKMEGKNAGASGWIVKPFDPDRLIATVRRVLD
jgi:two-component system, chemotaxis family, chemotaxis protein CheY